MAYNILIVDDSDTVRAVIATTQGFFEPLFYLLGISAALACVAGSLVDDEAVTALILALSNAHHVLLEVLDLSDNHHLSHRFAAALAQLIRGSGKNIKPLRVLQLKNTKLGDRGACLLAEPLAESLTVIVRHLASSFPTGAPPQ